jgi:hypothetical protein
LKEGKKTEETIKNWQRVAIYKAIADGNSKEGRPITFDDLKGFYLKAAQQDFFDKEITKDKIQDSSILLALMSLIEGKLIDLLEDGRYRLVFSSSWAQKLRDLELMELTEKRLGEKIKVKLDRETGRYDKAELWEALENPDTTYPHYMYVMQKMLTDGIAKETGGKLSLSRPDSAMAVAEP